MLGALQYLFLDTKTELVHIPCLPPFYPETPDSKYLKLQNVAITLWFMVRFVSSLITRSPIFVDLFIRSCLSELLQKIKFITEEMINVFIQPASSEIPRL